MARDVIIIRESEHVRLDLLELPPRVRLELRDEIFMVDVERRGDHVVAILDDAAEAALEACRSDAGHVSPLLFRPEAEALAYLNPRPQDMAVLVRLIAPPGPATEEWTPPPRRSSKRAQRARERQWSR